MLLEVYWRRENMERYKLSGYNSLSLDYNTFLVCKSIYDALEAPQLSCYCVFIQVFTLEKLKKHQSGGSAN
jgi:hypothetical protein